MDAKTNYRIRRIHRYLGVLLGIQFLMWTVGGLYFSWSDMDEIHGDYQKAAIKPLSADMKLVDPNTAIDHVRSADSVAFIHDLKLIQILNKPVYQIKSSESQDVKPSFKLVDAVTGSVIQPLNEEDATKVAIQGFNGEANVVKVEYLTGADDHHEYRGQALPSYAISFDHPSRTTVYVSTELGTIQKYRNDKWRLFDFLWMMHTMDYQTRDHFGNWLLKAFSIFGLLTISSGFVLFFISRKVKH